MAQSGTSVESINARKRTRSPAYPSLNLEDALMRAKQFHAHEGRNAANITVASKHWGYSEGSSSGAQTVAALISYGLMQDEGTGDKRSVRLTNNALRMLLDNRPDSPDRDELIRQAALSPKIHRQLWEKWDTLPSDASLRHILLFDWETPFNENSVDAFIKGLRETIAFARLSKSDKIDEVEVIQESGKPADVGQSEQNSPLKDQGTIQGNAQRLTTPPPKAGMDEMIVPLSDGRAIFQWPKELTQDDVEDLKDSLRILERKIKRSEKQEAAQ